MHHLAKTIGKLSTFQHIINLITIYLTLTPTSFLKESCLPIDSAAPARRSGFSRAHVEK